jgi:hypothetical protein
MSIELIRTREPREGGKQRAARAFMRAEAGEACSAELPPGEGVAKKVATTAEAAWVVTAAAAAAAMLAEAPEPVLPREVAEPWWRAAPVLGVGLFEKLLAGGGLVGERARERRALLAGFVGEDSTALDAVPLDEEEEEWG